MERFLFFGMLVLLPSFSYATCLDVTGDYDSGIIQEGKGSLIWSFKQDGCDSIATGSYYLWNSTKTDEVVPTINYVHEGKNELCESKQCFVFNETASGLEYTWNGSIKVKGIYSCHYNRVEITLDNQSLVRTFYIDDLSPNCKKTKTYNVIFNRIH